MLQENLKVRTTDARNSSIPDSKALFTYLLASYSIGCSQGMEFALYLHHLLVASRYGQGTSQFESQSPHLWTAGESQMWSLVGKPELTSSMNIPKPLCIMESWSVAQGSYED